jgi:hypothetical protein
MDQVDVVPAITSYPFVRGNNVLQQIGVGMLGAILGCLGGGLWGGFCLFVLCAILFGGDADIVGLGGGMVGGAVSGLVGGIVGGVTGQEQLAECCGRLAGLIAAPVLGWSLWGTVARELTPQQWLLVGVVGVAGFITGPVGGLIAFTLGKAGPSTR